MSDNLPAVTLPQMAKNMLPHKGERGKPLCTIENLKILLDVLGVTARYNVISKEAECIIPDVAFSIDNVSGASLAWVGSKMIEVGMPTGPRDESILYLSDQNQYNPVQNWIESRPWDGESRLGLLYDTITTLDEHTALKEALMYRWLIGAVASACTPTGVDSSGILVLQGPQNLGKTWWVRKLVPDDQLPDVVKTGSMIDPRDKDSVEQNVAKWIVELGELDATFKRSEIAALKAFLTNDRDIFRKSFARRAGTYPRRTAFVASVNPIEFLVDSTGNRRFWTIQCKKIDSYHNVNMQQLWAEVYYKWKQGETWRLNDNERSELEKLNDEHFTPDPLSEKIGRAYSWGSDEAYWRWLTASEILDELGVVRASKSDMRTCSEAVLKFNGDQKKRVSNARLLKIPAKIQGEK